MGDCSATGSPVPLTGHYLDKIVAYALPGGGT
jgi:hypothetical protein